MKAREEIGKRYYSGERMRGTERLGRKVKKKKNKSIAK